MPLLIALATGATAAAPVTPEQAALLDATASTDLSVREAKLGAALQRFSSSRDDAVWDMRILYAQTLIRRSNPRKAIAVLTPKPPARLPNLLVARAIELAVAHSRLNREATADELLAEAYALALRHSPRSLPRVLRMRGQFGLEQKRLAWIEEGLSYAKTFGDRDEEVALLAARAKELTRGGRYSEAIAVGEEAIRAARAMKKLAVVSNAEGNLGWAYEEIGDFETAAAHFTTAHDTARRVGSVVDQLRWLDQLGTLKYLLRDFEGAAKIAAEVLNGDRNVPDKHPDFALHLAQVARAAVTLGRWEDARRYTAEARAEARSANKKDIELTTMILEARIETAAGKLDRGRMLLEKALRQSPPAAKERWEAYLRLGEIELAGHHADRATAAFDKGIAAVRLARKQLSRDEHRLSFFNLVDELFERYVDFLVARHRVRDALRVTERRRALTLEEGLGISTGSTALDATAVAKRKNATILCYSLGRAHSFLWIVTPSTVALKTLPADKTIENAVDAHKREIFGPVAANARARELYNMIVAPAGPIAPGSRVIVIPDGPLHALNFETLVVPAAKPRYWIEDVIVITAPSIQLLARRAPAATPAKSMLLVGDVPQVAGFPRLESAAEEVGKVAARFNNETILRGPKATPSAYAKASPGSYEFVHFVAHGVATRRKPLDSAIILAREGDRYQLFAREIIKDQLHARLVTISSCHGAGTRAYVGEGLVGLAWAFLRAGAGQVIAALWEVSDNNNTTPKLMDQMYAGIRGGKDPAVALRDAKLAFVRSGDVTRYPRYWAPFVLYSGS